MSETKENNEIKQALEEISIENLPHFPDLLLTLPASEELKKMNFLRHLLNTKITENAEYVKLNLSKADLAKYAAVSMMMGYQTYVMPLPDFIVFLGKKGFDAQQLSQYADWAKSLGLFKKIAFKPLQHACQWVEPNSGGLYSSPSLNFSMLALITCVTAGINMGVLFQAWWTWIKTIVKPVYDAHKNEPPPVRVAHVWDTIKSSSQVCYRKAGTNYLHSILLYNTCQCSCGVEMMLEVMHCIDPLVQVSTFYTPGHIQLVVYDDTGQPYLLETTASEKLSVRILMSVFELDLNPLSLFPPSANDLAHLNTWLRIFTEAYENTQEQNLVPQSLCNLQTIFRLLPNRSMSMAIDVFRCFCGFANAIVERNAQEQDNMKQCLLSWQQHDMMPKLTSLQIGERFQILQQMAVKYQQQLQKDESFNCKNARATAALKQMRKWEKTYFSAPDKAAGRYDFVTFMNNLKQQEEKKEPVKLSESEKSLFRKVFDNQASQLIRSDSFPDLDFTMKRALRLAVAMMWYNPSIFYETENYKRYLETNKITADDFIKTSEWAERYDILSWDRNIAQENISKLKQVLQDALNKPLPYLYYDPYIIDQLYSYQNILFWLDEPKSNPSGNFTFGGIDLGGDEAEPEPDANPFGGFDFSGGGTEPEPNTNPVGGGFDFSGSSG